MSCNNCPPKNPCAGDCREKNPCNDKPMLDYVPGTLCSLGLTNCQGVTETLDLAKGIHACETATELHLNYDEGTLEYFNEPWLSSDGENGSKQSIEIKKFGPFINLEDLGNVADEAPVHCALLTYRADNDCGGNCEGIDNQWQPWVAGQNLASNTAPFKYLAVFDEDGCLQAMPAPTTGVSTIIGKNGNWYIQNTALPGGVNPNSVHVAVGNKNIYGVQSNLTTPDKSTFIATHPINVDVTGDNAFTSRTP